MAARTLGRSLSAEIRSRCGHARGRCLRSQQRSARRTRTHCRSRQLRALARRDAARSRKPHHSSICAGTGGCLHTAGGEKKTARGQGTPQGDLIPSYPGTLKISFIALVLPASSRRPPSGTEGDVQATSEFGSVCLAIPKYFGCSNFHPIPFLQRLSLTVR